MSKDDKKFSIFKKYTTKDLTNLDDVLDSDSLSNKMFDVVNIDGDIKSENLSPKDNWMPTDILDSLDTIEPVRTNETTTDESTTDSADSSD